MHHPVHQASGVAERTLQTGACRLLQQEADDPQSVETICNALDKVFLSPYGRSLLPLVVVSTLKSTDSHNAVTYADTVPVVLLIDTLPLPLYFANPQI